MQFPTFDLSSFDITLKSARAAVIREVGETLDSKWPAFCASLAAKVLEAEKKWKEQKNPALKSGYLRLDWVKSELRKQLATSPLREGIFEAFWAIIQEKLSTVIDKINATIGKDWVGRFEEVESEVTNELERYFQVDLDNDGDIGIEGVDSAPFVVLLALAASLFLGAGDAQAVGKYERYTPATAPLQVEAAHHEEHKRTVTPVLVESPGPKYERYVTTEKPPVYSTGEPVAGSLADYGVTVESWIGASRRPGIDAGIGIVARSGNVSGGIQAASDRLGVCVGYRRVGVNYLWDPTDGSMELGGYFSPLRF